MRLKENNLIRAIIDEGVYLVMSARTIIELGDMPVFTMSVKRHTPDINRKRKQKL